MESKGRGKSKSAGKSKGGGKGKKSKTKDACSIEDELVTKKGVLEVNGIQEPPKTKWSNGDFQKFNYDSGAGVTLLPKHFLANPVISEDKCYKTASGEFIEDYGAAKVLGTDESGTIREIQGRVSDVHKPLLSAHDVSMKGGLNAYITELGGFLIPRSSKLGSAIEKSVRSLIKKHQGDGLIRMAWENSVLNFYLKMEGEGESVDALRVASVEPSVAQSPGNPGH